MALVDDLEIHGLRGIRAGKLSGVAVQAGKESKAYVFALMEAGRPIVGASSFTRQCGRTQ